MNLTSCTKLGTAPSFAWTIKAHMLYKQLELRQISPAIHNAASLTRAQNLSSPQWKAPLRLTLSSTLRLWISAATWISHLCKPVNTQQNISKLTVSPNTHQATPSLPFQKASQPTFREHWHTSPTTTQFPSLTSPGKLHPLFISAKPHVALSHALKLIWRNYSRVSTTTAAAA